MPEQSVESLGKIVLGRYPNSGAEVWLVDTQPHVALRLKRVFSKIRSGAQGVLQISNTPENCRDLHWFLQRYPHEVSHPKILLRQCRAHKEEETIVSQLTRGIGIREQVPMALPPRDYQILAADLANRTGGTLCGDDVGLGKTVTGIAAIVDDVFRPSLVVTLPHLCDQWAAFIARFAPELRTHIISKGRPYHIAGRTPDVLISSYSKLAGWAGTLATVLRSVIWDEVQELRHDDTDKYNAALVIANAPRMRMRFGLSATPIYNYGDEMFNVMEVIKPGALGTRDEFLTEWCYGGKLKDPRAFGHYLRSAGLMLRRTRAEVGRELPGCQAIVHPVAFDSSYFDKATQDCTDLAQVILAEKQDWKGQKMHANAQFDMRMRQATGIAKAPYVCDFVKMLVENGEQVALYGWHREVYAIWQKRLEEYSPVLYTGSETPSQKLFNKARFLRGEARIAMISLRSGQGLDGLQDVCSTVVFGELDWSPGVHEQCIGRVFRDGQKKPVFAYYLLADEGSDPVIADTLELKTQQITGLRDPDAELLEELQVDRDHIKKLAKQYLKNKGLRS